MSSWSGSSYEGDYKDGWYHGKGKYYYANGVIYEGDFVKGEFHGDGILIYPNGGHYKARWQNGKMINGEYFFKDHLEYNFKDWGHCTKDDRRFYQQALHGIKPAGATQTTRQDVPHSIPKGTYDVGEGYYQPVKSIIYGYDGKMLRTPSESEVENIVAKCRYNPHQLNIGGQDDKMIKKVVEKNRQQEQE